MKIKFTSDDSLFLKKMLELHNMVIIVGSVFREDNKFYLQDFLDEFLYKLELLKYNRTDGFEGVGVNRPTGSQKCIICYYW